MEERCSPNQAGTLPEINPEPNPDFTTKANTLDRGDIIDIDTIRHDIPTCFTSLRTESGLVGLFDHDIVGGGNYGVLTIYNENGYAGLAIADYRNTPENRNRPEIGVHTDAIEVSSLITGYGAKRTGIFEEKTIGDLVAGDFALVKDIPNYNPENIIDECGHAKVWVLDSYTIPGCWKTVLTLGNSCKYWGYAVADVDDTVTAADGETINLKPGDMITRCPLCRTYGTIGIETGYCQWCGFAPDR
jgi:hypothetical protein